MNNLKQFQNGVNEDGEVVIPFIGGLTYPVRQIDGHIKGCLLYTSEKVLRRLLKM